MSTRIVRSRPISQRHDAIPMRRLSDENTTVSSLGPSDDFDDDRIMPANENDFPLAGPAIEAGEPAEDVDDDRIMPANENIFPPGGPATEAGPSAEGEDDHIPPADGRNTEAPELSSMDVCAFIVNKMIGTGIFTAPPAVLLLTRSKAEVLFLWILGFLYTLVSMVIYLQFARKLPYTGGELVYLDETLRKPAFLTWTIYSFYFVFLYNASTNCLQFANQVLLAANSNREVFEPDSRVLRFIAIATLSFFCLLHYFSAQIGRVLNRFLTYFKIALLLSLILAGSIRASSHYVPDWTRSANSNVASSAAAFLLVTGEVRNPQTLKRGFVLAIWTVGILYILVVLVFLLAVPYEDVTGPKAVVYFAPVFFGGGPTAQTIWAIFTCISSAGSILSVIYTCGRVKQIIGTSNILPWSKMWKLESAVRDTTQGKVPTPQGGLMLHWISATTMIAATAAIENIEEAIRFPGSLGAYCSGFVGIFICIGFPYLFIERKFPIYKPWSSVPDDSNADDSPRFWIIEPREIEVPTSWTETSSGTRFPDSWVLKRVWRRWLIGLSCLTFNIYIVIIPLYGPYKDSSGHPLEVKGWYYIIIAGSVALFGLSYYYLTIGLAHRGGSILRFAGVRLSIDHSKAANGEAVKVRIDSHATGPSYLYWFFGGSQKQHYPNNRVVRYFRNFW
ncbi:amino acid permease-domain-containing protein [Amylocarpus encephaloides]|uniref:Amino acid permease-domain-containing protein n=1 Tax=Amylocarpus encephaloides TaxID=45428 RepID=A0A9P7YAC0_9HELO|nr:amino acid permease-domain-containing protein [Amylocarpus encephaloides]